MELLILLRTAVSALGSYKKGKTTLACLLVSYTPLARPRVAKQKELQPLAPAARKAWTSDIHPSEQALTS